MSTIKPHRRRIIRNAIQCNHCGDVIESTYRHDYKKCSCGRVAVDGGLDYLRRGYQNPGDFTELSETVPVEEETLTLKSALTEEEIRKNFEGVDVGAGIISGLEEAVAFEDGTASEETTSHIT